MNDATKKDLAAGVISLTLAACVGLSIGLMLGDWMIGAAAFNVYYWWMS